MQENTIMTMPILKIMWTARMKMQRRAYAAERRTNADAAEGVCSSVEYEHGKAK